ncbi:MAG: tetratricopeptide repeat protein [Bacteroidales bacterium]|nr:tetratricopeptide repeat protein [Bacteroidales bacterium]
MKKIILSFIFCISAIALFPQQPKKDYLKSSNPRATEFFNKANTNLTDNYEEILYNYNLAIDLDPEYIMAYNNRGMLLSDHGKYKEAMDDFMKIYNSDKTFSNNNNILLYIAFCKLKLGDYQGAIDDYSNVLKAFPKNFFAYSGRGDAKVALKDTIGAINDYNASIRLGPQAFNVHDVFLNRGLLKQGQKKYQEALVDMNDAVRTAPDNSMNYMYYYRGLLKIIMKDKAGACADLKQAVELGEKRAESPLHQNCGN